MLLVEKETSTKGILHLNISWWNGLQPKRNADYAHLLCVSQVLHPSVQKLSIHRYTVASIWWT